MVVREKRQVLRSLVTPGSSKFCALKNAQHQLLYIVLLLNADDYGLLPGSSVIGQEKTVTSPATEVLRLAINLGFTLETTSAGLKALEKVGLIKIHMETDPIIIEITQFDKTQDWRGVQKRESNLVQFLPSTRKNFHSTTDLTDSAEGTVLYCSSPSSKSLVLEGTLPQTADEAFELARKFYLAKTNRKMSGLGNRKYQWERICGDEGPAIVALAFKLWVDDLRPGFIPDSPFGLFLKSAETFLADARADVKQDVEIAAQKKSSLTAKEKRKALESQIEAAGDAQIQARVQQAEEESKRNSEVANALASGF